MLNDEMVAALRNSLDSEIVDRVLKQNLGSKKDIFSEIFENVMTHKERKKHGQFFTHKELVNYIINNVKVHQSTSILDPACGAGAFLSSILQNVDSGENIYGVDIDPRALEMCKLNLMHVGGENRVNLLEKDTIKNLELSDFPTVAAQGGFDVIVGNPPYLQLVKGKGYDPENMVYKDIISGIANACTLFIGKSLSLLKEGGTLAFILPKNLLRVESFSAIRNYILENCAIMEVFDLGHYFKDVRCDQIVLILKKKCLSKEEKVEHLVKVSILNKGDDFSSPSKYEISQSFFDGARKYPIYLEKDMFEVVQKLENMPEKLADVSNGIFRGISIGANHETVMKSEKGGSRKILRGQSLSRFKVSSNLYLSSDAEEIVSRQRFERQEEQRIALQNIISREGGITACVVEEDCYNLDTVTNVVLKDKSLNVYVTGILNSRLSNFFTILAMFLHSNFTMHADKVYIGNIPIVIPEQKDKRNKVEIIVNKLSKMNRTDEGYWNSYDELNIMLYEIYGLDDDEISVINRTLKNVMSVKSNG